MRWQDLARFHTRAVGVFFGCLGLVGLVWQASLLQFSYRPVFGTGEAAYTLALLLLPSTLTLLLGGVLFVRGDHLVARAEQAGWTDLPAVERVLLSVLGVYFLANGAIDATRWLNGRSMPLGDVLLPVLFETLLGLALYLGCARLGVVGRLIAAAVTFLRKAPDQGK